MGNKTIISGYSTPPNLDDLEDIAKAIIGELPKELSKYTGKLKVEIEEFPDDYIEAELELQSEFDLLGYYQSAGPKALNSTHKSQKQDVICLYRRPILDAWCETCDDLTKLVNKVILQEIGHHFGFSEGEMEIYEEDMLADDADNLIVCE